MFQIDAVKPLAFVFSMVLTSVCYCFPVSHNSVAKGFYETEENTLTRYNGQNLGVEEKFLEEMTDINISRTDEFIFVSEQSNKALLIFRRTQDQSYRLHQMFIDESRKPAIAVTGSQVIKNFGTPGKILVLPERDEIFLVSTCSSNQSSLISLKLGTNQQWQIDKNNSFASMRCNKSVGKKILMQPIKELLQDNNRIYSIGPGRVTEFRFDRNWRFHKNINSPSWGGHESDGGMALNHAQTAVLINHRLFVATNFYERPALSYQTDNAALTFSLEESLSTPTEASHLSITQAVWCSQRQEIHFTESLLDRVGIMKWESSAFRPQINWQGVINDSPTAMASDEGCDAVFIAGGSSGNIYVLLNEGFEFPWTMDIMTRIQDDSDNGQVNLSAMVKANHARILYFIDNINDAIYGLKLPPSFTYEENITTTTMTKAAGGAPGNSYRAPVIAISFTLYYLATHLLHP